MRSAPFLAKENIYCCVDISCRIDLGGDIYKDICTAKFRFMDKYL